jgi:hypothetical protein
MVAERDRMREMAVQQGYVPPACKLSGILIIYLVYRGQNPCWGCNVNREDCGGARKLSENEAEDVSGLGQNESND